MNLSLRHISQLPALHRQNKWDETDNYSLSMGKLPCDRNAIKEAIGVSRHHFLLSAKILHCLIQYFFNLWFDFGCLGFQMVFHGFLPDKSQCHEWQYRMRFHESSCRFSYDSFNAIAGDGEGDLFFTDSTNNKNILISTFRSIAFIRMLSGSAMYYQRIGCKFLSSTKCRGDLSSSFECADFHRIQRGPLGPSVNKSISGKST